MASKKYRTIGEYTEKLKNLELERFLNKKDGNVKRKKKRRKKKPKPKQVKQSAWKIKYYKYLESDEWAQIRIDILNDRKCCERCGSKRALRIHHKTYDNVFNEEPEDLELLCKVCHDKEHNLK